MWPFSKPKPIIEMSIILVGPHLYLNLKNPDKDSSEADEEINPTMPYMFYVDRVLGNLNEAIASMAINKLLKLVEDTVHKSEMLISEDELEELQVHVKTDIKWNIVSSQEKLEVYIKTLSKEDASYALRAKATIFFSNDSLYCNTVFSNTKDIEFVAIGSIEALFIYLTAVLPSIDYMRCFLPAFRSQLLFYDGHKPSVATLGEAPTLGFQNYQKLRKEFT